MAKTDIIYCIENDEWMMDVLRTVRDLRLPDWWIGAGFVRGKVWDTLHGYLQRTPLTDIDVIYFDRNDYTAAEATSESTAKEKLYERELEVAMPGQKWSVTNQARMHTFHNTKQYRNATEGLADWVETATCIGVKMDYKNKLLLTTPHGIEDLTNLILRPTSMRKDRLDDFHRRIIEKRWLAKWPKLKVIEN
ncbi:nucleotidyltransferase family protein [Patescibacteria group bacterium]|nr:nucleotidyltransferase family protein [Patescibacteria group bacterium]